MLFSDFQNSHNIGATLAIMRKPKTFATIYKKLTNKNTNPVLLNSSLALLPPPIVAMVPRGCFSHQCPALQTTVFSVSGYSCVAEHPTPACNCRQPRQMSRQPSISPDGCCGVGGPPPARKKSYIGGSQPAIATGVNT